MSVAGKTLAIVGGDRRMLAAAEVLAARGAWVRVTGLVEDVRVPAVIRCIGIDEVLVGATVVLLPVQPVGADGLVHTEPAVPALYLRPPQLDRVRPGTLFFAGVASSELKTELAARGHRLVEYRERDDFALYNSVPAAEGALAMAMAASPLTLSGSRSVVLGMGRTGGTLAGMLRGLASRVLAVSRVDVELARAFASGHDTAHWRELPAALETADFVFNTAPALVLTRERLALLPRHSVVIDLASAPGGTDFAAAAELGVRALLAPGLPGKTAPATAGRLVAEMVIRHLAGEDGATVVNSEAPGAAAAPVPAATAGPRRTGAGQGAPTDPDNGGHQGRREVGQHG